MLSAHAAAVLNIVEGLNNDTSGTKALDTLEDQAQAGARHSRKLLLLQHVHPFLLRERLAVLLDLLPLLCLLPNPRTPRRTTLSLLTPTLGRKA